MNDKPQPRYVDANKVLEEFCAKCGRHFYENKQRKQNWFCEGFCDIKEKIDNVPTENVIKAD